MYNPEPYGQYALATLPRSTHDSYARPSAGFDAPQPAVDQIRYTAGAALTAGVAVLTAVLAMILTHGILGLSVFGANDTLIYVLAAAGISFAAAALFNAMLHIAPRPNTYFGALSALGLGVAATVPFTTTSPIADQIGLAMANLAVGCAIALLVPLAAGPRR
jgi:hypothetical protein